MIKGIIHQEGIQILNLYGFNYIIIGKQKCRKLQREKDKCTQIGETLIYFSSYLRDAHKKLVKQKRFESTNDRLSLYWT